MTFIWKAVFCLLAFPDPHASFGHLVSLLLWLVLQALQVAMSLCKWDLQRDPPPCQLMKGAMGILFCFCFFNLSSKREGKLCSGFANSPCFLFTLIFTID